MSKKPFEIVAKHPPEPLFASPLLITPGRFAFYPRGGASELRLILFQSSDPKQERLNALSSL